MVLPVENAALAGGFAIETEGCDQSALGHAAAIATQANTQGPPPKFGKGEVLFTKAGERREENAAQSECR
jgi:hypothetical protein